MGVAYIIQLQRRLPNSSAVVCGGHTVNDEQQATIMHGLRIFIIAFYRVRLYCEKNHYALR